MNKLRYVLKYSPLARASLLLLLIQRSESQRWSNRQTCCRRSSLERTKELASEAQRHVVPHPQIMELYWATNRMGPKWVELKLPV
jgi:hypothetical protein